MSFIDAIKEMRCPKVPEEKGLIVFILNVFPGVGTLLGSIWTEDADNKVLGIIQICLIFVSWIPLIGPIIFICNWGFSMFWGFKMFQASKQ
ncbi:hypothetical protein J8273_7259 [Carpediemonas membranifera]|uniref:Uncharacterized protein n=1 Tax=Carpediemonas membranifera TaxID=201153 RepID=A0A8J6DZN4_9EUKA|nr:hypothetical protein J8273_7256 [Carpediemonas membranifera]KAG9390983.1 hypothetical protein J8273_7257 [Carpediemonas membranifera]KAG9390984.1 hypothetical protein J8273_7258 [Carpediemonas membranifera]KAG9390985.1 hypothetical protein J8273_7259 [Carpediemonas membranifera]|eukprot:KAG9390982.1 hypothetical protein J8273_7256 [Carpediemonas membranifera]